MRCKAYSLSLSGSKKCFVIQLGIYEAKDFFVINETLISEERNSVTLFTLMPEILCACLSCGIAGMSGNFFATIVHVE